MSETKNTFSVREWVDGARKDWHQIAGRLRDNECADAAFLLARYACTGPAGTACLALVAVAGAFVAIWTRFLVGRLAAQRVN